MNEKKELCERRYGLRDDLLSDLFYPLGRKSQNMMVTDIAETEREYILSIEVPGVEKKDLNIDFNDGYISVTAGSGSSEEKEEESYIRRERYRGTFTRSFYIGDIDQESIKAKLEDGVLTITVPKAKEVVKKTNISIE